MRDLSPTHIQRYHLLSITTFCQKKQMEHADRFLVNIEPSLLPTHELRTEGVRSELL